MLYRMEQRHNPGGPAAGHKARMCACARSCGVTPGPRSGFVHGLDCSIVSDDRETGLVAGCPIPRGRGLTRRAYARYTLSAAPSPTGWGDQSQEIEPTAMQSDKKHILNRLATIDGHLKGIRKMVEEDQYCVDIVKQSYAVERALKAFEAALLEGHLASCVPNGFKEGRDQEMIRELGELFELSRK
jgi:CsoR family transcriptional regulator, copper-sensing transcriptional repressor